MNNIYIKLRKGKIARTLCLDDQVNLDRDEDGEIVGVELLNVKEVSINGNKIKL